jgi:hypothetical protein
MPILPCNASTARDFDRIFGPHTLDDYLPAKFKHVQQPKPPPANLPLFNTKCKFFEQGRCTKGNTCQFLHEERPSPVVFHNGEENERFRLKSSDRCDARIYFKNFPPHTKSGDVLRTIEHIGTITGIKVLEPKSERGPIAGFIHMEDKGAAYQVIQTLNRLVIPFQLPFRCSAGQTGGSSFRRPVREYAVYAHKHGDWDVCTSRHTMKVDSDGFSTPRPLKQLVDIPTEVPLAPWPSVTTKSSLRSLTPSGWNPTRTVKICVGLSNARIDDMESSTAKKIRWASAVTITTTHTRMALTPSPVRFDWGDDDDEGCYYEEDDDSA